MPLPFDYRWISVANLKIRNRMNAPDYAPHFEIADLLNAMRERSRLSDEKRLFGADESLMMWHTELSDRDEKFFVFLMHIADKNVASSAYLDFVTGTKRTFEKDINEGGLYSSHILLSKEPDEFGEHLIFVERVPGITLATVATQFTWICNSNEFKKNAQNESGDLKSFRAHFECLGYKSKTLQAAIRDGVLKDIEFVKREFENQGWDEDQLVRETDLKSSWKINRRLGEQQAKTVIEKAVSAFENFRGGVDDAALYVRIKDANDQIRRTEIDLGAENLLQQAFSQNEIINNFDEPLTSAYDIVRDDVVEKMSNIVVNR